MTDTFDVVLVGVWALLLLGSLTPWARRRVDGARLWVISLVAAVMLVLHVREILEVRSNLLLGGLFVVVLVGLVVQVRNMVRRRGSSAGSKRPSERPFRAGSSDRRPTTGDR